MTLKARLETARADYQNLPAARSVPPPTELHGARRGRRLLGAVAAAALVVGGIGWWSRLGADSTMEATAPAEVPDSNAADPPGAVALYSTDVLLDPIGPYRDDQYVTLSVPDGFADDLANSGVRECAVLADGPGGPGEWCDPVERTVVASSSATSVQVRVNRVVFTPTGDRDCEDPAVTCRLVVHAANGHDVASGALAFAGDPPARSASIDVSPTGTPGEALLATTGVEPHPSWQQLRSSDPQRAADFGPFWVSVCAFGEPDEPKDPWGTNRWYTPSSGQTVRAPNCDQYDPVATIDPDNPSAPAELSVPTWFLGYGGWNDCRADQCFVQIRRTIVSGLTPAGVLVGGDEVVATALLAADLADPDGTRPQLRILTPGPHLAGQELTVEVTGLGEARTTSIGVCQTGNEWGCGYLGASMNQIDNGTHLIRLPEQLNCPQHCYLELDSQGEGMPPQATAPLATND